MISENSSSPAVADGETAASVNMYTRSSRGRSGLGTTTNGCRPISVKTHPVMFAAKGAPIPRIAKRISPRLSGTVPRRVSHHAATQASAASPPKVIIRRKPQ